MTRVVPRSDRRHEVLNLGAGVQSTAVLLMCQKGELPAPDVAIFADTGWEPAEVYRHLDWLEETVTVCPIVRVTAGSLRDDVLEKQVGMSQEGGFASVPFHTEVDGNRGMLRRQCTREYKIDPIRQYVRQHVVGVGKGERVPKGTTLRQWFGISFDEMQRMRIPDVAWVQHWYPLVELKMRRMGCLEWLERNKYPTPPRSACLGCPYHSNEEWRKIRANDTEWQDVVQFDTDIRTMGGMRGDTYLHRSCVPLDQVDLRTDRDHGQLPLWDDECEGMCGV